VRPSFCAQNGSGGICCGGLPEVPNLAGVQREGG